MLKNTKLDINKTDKHGINAFWMAACKGHYDVIIILFSFLIDVLSLKILIASFRFF